MHRVELKAGPLLCRRIADLHVPNAPCGVESTHLTRFYRLQNKPFLMHRVELKDGFE